jgi:hypothetical protein
MDVQINRLNPNVPDPVESRRRAAGRFVRIAYATIVFGLVAFFVMYFGSPLVFLSGPGIVAAPRYVVSLPYTVQVNQTKLLPGATVKAGEPIAEVISPEQDSIVATYMQALADIAGRTAELRIKARIAKESLEAARSYMQVTEEAAERMSAMATATVTFRMEVLRERASARKAVVSLEAEVAESAFNSPRSMPSFNSFKPASRRWRAISPTAVSLRRLPESVGPVSRRPDSRWRRARRSPKSSTRATSSYTGTFPMPACSIPRSGTKCSCCSETATSPEESTKSCPFPLRSRERSRRSCWRRTVLQRRSPASASMPTCRRRR